MNFRKGIVCLFYKRERENEGEWSRTDKENKEDILSHQCFVILMHFYIFFIHLEILHTLCESDRFFYVYSTKKMKGNCRELMEWDCINNCDVNSTVTWCDWLRLLPGIVQLQTLIAHCVVQFKLRTTLSINKPQQMGTRDARWCLIKIQIGCHGANFETPKYLPVRLLQG